MAEYDAFTRQELLEELRKKEAVTQKFKNKLVLTHEKFLNFKTLLEQSSSLRSKLDVVNQDLKERVQECETLRTRHNILERACQEAGVCVEEQERKIRDLTQELKTAAERADKADHTIKQAKADSTRSAMVRQNLESDLVALRKHLVSLQSALAKVTKQQQDDHQDVIELKTQASKPAHAEALVPRYSRQTCQGCSAVQQAVVELKQQLGPLPRSLSVRGSTYADSVPSTQDHSGDTNDDREAAQLRSDMSGMQQQLQQIHEQHRQWSVDINRWRKAFRGLAGDEVSAEPEPAQLAAASGRMQISPLAAEGSNIMPRQAFRPDPAEVRRARQGSSPPNGEAQAQRDATPQAGSTAGDGEDVGRLDTLAAGSDSMSNVAGTAASLMQPAQPQAQPALRLLPSQAQPRPPGPAKSLAHLHNRPPAEPESAVSPREKRTTIALNPGRVADPHHGRKRKRPATKGAEQQQPAEQQVHSPKSQQQHQQQQQQVYPSTPQRQQQQPQHQEAGPANGASQAYLARFGIKESDATAVDFLELQLARIMHTDEEITSGLASSVTQYIFSAWQLSHCPLHCIISAFVSSFLECAAAPNAHSLCASKRPRLGTGPHDGDVTHSQEQDPNPQPRAEQSTSSLEEAPMAKLWCSSAARKEGTFSWLLHCALKLDNLLSSPPAAPTHTQTASKGGPSGKRRGRPPGSKNKKTLQRLQQAAGLSLPEIKHAKQAPPQQQPQQQAGVTAVQGQGRSAVRLEPGALLDGLHRQVLHFLGQSCRVTFPGPFETEVCCLAATAAALARLMGKSLPLGVQVYDTLKAADTSATTKLHSIAAALEMWPTALLLKATEACPDASSSVAMPCIHAALQSLVSSFQQEGAAGQAATTARAGLSVPANAVPESLSTAARENSKLAVQCWGQNRFTQMAASQLHDMYAQHWQQQQQQQQQSKCTDDGAFLACPPQPAGTLWSIALPSVAAKFQQLCTEGPADEGETVMWWLQLHTSLELAISCMGWEWALDQVTGNLIGAMIGKLLPAASDGSPWALSTMTHVLECLRHATSVIVRFGTKEQEACSQGMQALAEGLEQAASEVQHQQLHTLFKDAAEAVGRAWQALQGNRTPHPMPETVPNELPKMPCRALTSPSQMQQKDTVVPADADPLLGSCNVCPVTKYNEMGAEVEEI